MMLEVNHFVMGIMREIGPANKMTPLDVAKRHDF